MKRPTILVIPGGLITTGFSERRARRKNLHRQYTTCDTAVKNTSNPEWMRLPPMCRLAHDELERWSGQRVTGGRIVGAKLFNRADWRAVAGTERMWIDKLVAAAWAEWNGNDLVLLGIDLVGEENFVARLVDKKLHAVRRGRHADGLIAKIAPCQTAETSHFEDRAPAPASIRSEIRSDPAHPSRGKKPVPPPPPPGGETGGGGTPNGSGRPEPDAFRAWYVLYDKTDGPPADGADAAAAWAELGMRPAEVRACLDFTRRKLRERQNTRDAGAWKAKPGKFLREVWGKELSKLRKKADAKNGHHHPETAADIMGSYMENLRGDA